MALRSETPAAVFRARQYWPRRKQNQHTARTPLQRLMGSLAFDDSDCWLFRGSHTNLGYGIIHAAGEKRAHRLAWVLFNGPIPNGMHVLHKCDVRCCVNPDHLFLGTHADNMRDMTQKGRGKLPRLSGESNPLSKLTEKAVEAILDEYALGGTTQYALAHKHNVAVMTINRVLNHKSWVKK